MQFGILYKMHENKSCKMWILVVINNVLLTLRKVHDMIILLGRWKRWPDFINSGPI